MGRDGSSFHCEVAIPLLLRLLQPSRGERIVDVGCGQGVLARQLAGIGCEYTGVDASHPLVSRARRRAPRLRFVVGEAARLVEYGVPRGSFDAAGFLLCLQDMGQLDKVLELAAEVLAPAGDSPW